MCIRRFSSRAASRRIWLSDNADFKATVAGEKDINRGILFPPLAVTRMMAERVGWVPAAARRTRPAGRARRVVGTAPADSGEDGGVRVWRGRWGKWEPDT